MQAPGSACDTIAGSQDGVLPHPVYPLAHQVDPGVSGNPAVCRCLNSRHHVLFPFVTPNIRFFRFRKIGGGLNLG